MKLKNNYNNKQLAIVMLDRFRVEQSIETDKSIIQKYESGYMKPVSKYGMAQFYAPYKQLGNIKIDTYWFNLILLWVVIIVLYVALYYNLLQKLITGLENLKLKESDK